MSAVGVPGSMVPDRGTGAGSTPSTALHSILVKPISFAAAKKLIVRNHYLHSVPGGTKLTFGVFLGIRLLGAVVFGAGPTNAHRVIEGASRNDSLTLTRLWLSDELPRNSESRVIGVLIRSIHRHTSVKFLLSYADPMQGHRGTIYQATGWTYTGLSEVMSLYDLGDGIARHSRSLGQVYGSRSVRYFITHGVRVKLVPQAAKHRYIYFLDRSWCSRLKVGILPYPRMEVSDGNS